MEKKYFFIILLMQLSFAQPPAIQWQKSFGGSEGEGSYNIQQTIDGGYIVIGYTFSVDGDITGNHGGNDFWVVKTSSSGSMEWEKTFGGTNDDYCNSVQQTSDGGYILAGQIYSNNGDVTENNGNADIWIVKLSSSGDILWQKAIGGTAADWAEGIQQATDGGYIVVGCTNSNNGDVNGNHGSTDGWVIKTDSAGNIIWQKSIGGSAIDGTTDIRQTVDGGYVVAGYTRSSNGDVSGIHGTQDAWIIKLSDIGNLQWQKTFGGANFDRANCIQQTTDGNYIVGCSTESIDGDVTGNHGGQDAWILRLNSLGDILWQKTIGGSAYEFVHSIQQTTDNGYIFAGLTYSNNGDVAGGHGGSDAWVVKLDNIGDLQWQKVLGGSGADYFYGLQQTSDNGFIVCGETYSNDGDVTNNHGFADYWVVKLEAETLGNPDNDYNGLTLSPNPASFELFLQNPNNTAYDKIVVVDLSGKIVIEEFQFFNRVNVQKLAAGIYVVHAYLGDEKVSGKFVKQ